MRVAVQPWANACLGARVALIAAAATINATRTVFSICVLSLSARWRDRARGRIAIGAPAQPLGRRGDSALAQTDLRRMESWAMGDLA